MSLVAQVRDWMMRQPTIEGESGGDCELICGQTQVTKSLTLHHDVLG